MKRIASMLLAVLGLASGSAWASVGQVIDVAGEVKTTLGSQGAQAAGRGASVENGMIVSTGERSHAVLKFEDGQTVVLQANTSFQINDYHYDRKEIGKSNIFFSMLKGGLRAITGLIGSNRHEAFRLQTPMVTIGIRGTDFMTALSDQLYSQVTTGSISMTNAAGTAVFSAGQTAAAASAATLPVSISAAALPAGTFTQLGTIPVPGAAAGASAAPSAPGASASAEAGTAASGGGAAAGAAGVSGTTVAVGAAVAAGAAALANTSTTTHH